MAWGSEVQSEVDKSQLLEIWCEANEALKDAKEKESELRLKVVNAFFPIHTNEGTTMEDLGDGWKLKAVFKMTRTLADKEKVDEALTKIEKIAMEGQSIAAMLINWKPSLDKKTYDKLSTFAVGQDCKRIIDTVLTIKPASTSLELVAPKGKRTDANNSK